jgi:2-hydroxy-3-oxopropionate reductase
MLDIVITMLTDDDAVEKVLSDQGFQENLKKGSTRS